MIKVMPAGGDADVGPGNLQNGAVSKIHRGGSEMAFRTSTDCCFSPSVCSKLQRSRTGQAHSDWLSSQGSRDENGDLKEDRCCCEMLSRET